MSLTPSIVQSGTNSRTTTAEEFNQLSTLSLTPGVEGSIGYGTPVTGDSAVQAQSSPNKTVKILSGVVWMSVTPTGQSARTIRVPHGGLTSLTIADNTSGSTKYDKILIVLDADTLLAPPADGDFAEATCIIAERHNAANEAITAANAIELAEVTVANGFASIANSAIADKRTHVSVINGNLNGGWTTYTGAKTYTNATRIAITSGDNVKFPVGTKIRYKQGGDWKYGSVYANDTAYIDVTGGSDYTVANAAIDVLEYSYDASPVGFPDYFATPFSMIGSGGSAGAFATDLNGYYFRIIGKFCHLFGGGRITNKGSWSGDVMITIPIPSKSLGTRTFYPTGFMAAQGANPGSKASIHIDSGSDTVMLASATIYTGSLQWTSVAQFDSVIVNGMYPIA